MRESAEECGMRIISGPAELQTAALRTRQEGRSIGLVPTMGALHDGHLSLVRRARSENDVVIVTIFVNPTQFGPSEDLERYPRALENDLSCCRREGVDIVFSPEPAAMYPKGFQTYVEVGALQDHMCGRSRPGHFRGVATVCLKLFNLAQPTRAYFGMKDYQQLAVLRRMAEDFNLPLEIVGMPIVRDPDGLAMSSRNRYLQPDERRAALVLRRSLDAAEDAWRQGERSADKLAALVRGVLESEPLARVDYVEALDPETLEPAATPAGLLLIAIAVLIGSTRLIDNTVLE